MEVISWAERRLAYGEAGKAAVVAPAAVPDATVRELSRRLAVGSS